MMIHDLSFAATILAANLAARPILDCIDHHVVGRYFDWKYRVETIGCIDSATFRFGEKKTIKAEPYMPMPARVLRSILAALDLSYSDFEFVDVGSGKGRAMLIAAEFPFQHITGVEISPNLVSLAEKNLSNYKNHKQKCKKFNLICKDILGTEAPDGNCVFFLFNPFDADTTQEFLDRAVSKLERNKGKYIFILYHPRNRRPFDSCPLLTEVSLPGAITEVFSVYESI